MVLYSYKLKCFKDMQKFWESLFFDCHSFHYTWIEVLETEDVTDETETDDSKTCLI